MRKVIISLFIILFVFISSAGCTYTDETVKMVVTDRKIIEPGNQTAGQIGIMNLTIHNEHNGELSVTEDNFQITGEDVTMVGTILNLYITNFTIIDNASSKVKKGESRKIVIEHIQYDDVILKKITFKNGDIELGIDLTKEKEDEVLVTPSVFKTNYFIFTLVFIISIVMLLIILGRQRSAPPVGRNLCKFCLEDLSKIDEKDRLYCNKWKTRTKRCGEGPFCSKRCLEYHLEDVTHET